MRRRTHFSLLVQSSLLGAVTLLAGPGLFDAKVIAQAPAFKQKEVKLKLDKEISEKAAEKNKARSGKTDKLDLAPLDEYYRDFLIPLLTQSSPEGINRARKEILDDIDTIEKNKDLSPKFNTYLIAQMRELAIKDKEGKTYAPPTRINAAILLGRLNAEVASGSLPRPETKVQQSLLEFVEQKENDGLLSSALSTLTKHVRAAAVSEAGRNKFVQVLQAQLTAPPTLTRDPDAQNYLTEQMIQCLTEIAKLDPDKGAGKLAATALTPVLLKIIEEQQSEWLVEAALVSFGTIKPVNLKPEDAITLEKGIAKFAKQSLKDWKKRIASSGSVSTSGYPGGGGSELSGGPGGGMTVGGPGGGGGSGGKGPGGGGGGGADGGGGAGGYPGGAAPTQPTNPFKKQPDEVKNARRIAHQRFERIHVSLNGSFKKSVPTPPPATPAEEKALVALLSGNEKEKENVTALLSKIEQFQKELNDDKVTDLASLTLAVSKSVKEIRAACDLILGEKKEAVAALEDEGF